MALARTIWRILVGIKDALALLFLLLFFGIVWAALSLSGGEKPQANLAGVLDLDLAGTIVEQPTRANLQDALAGTAPSEIRARDLVVALEAAADDDDVKVVALDLDRFDGGGQVDLEEVGAALDKVRKAKKPVLAFATYYSDAAYLLAAHASEIWMHPMGAVVLRGKGGTNLYFKELTDRLGVTMNVYKVGTYKAAVEPFTRSDMSEPARENAEALVGALADNWNEAVAKARPAAKGGVNAMLKDPVAPIEAAGGDFAKAALATKLVDKVATRNEFERRLAELGGDAAEGREEEVYRRIALDDYSDWAYGLVDDGAVAVVTVAGDIVDGEAGPGTAAGDSIAELIRDASSDEDMKALVLRVDSPGGSVTASEVIREALVDFKAKGNRPIIVSMGNVAASGGYWVSTPADRIFAEPSTITGSIGVFGIIPSFEKSLDKLGIGTDGVATGPMSGQPDLLGGINPTADKLIQAGVEATYRDFLDRVSKARKKSPEAIDRIAQGRVWDGGTARQLGLVDTFGGLDDAVAEAAKLAKLEGKDAAIAYFDPPMTSYERFAEWWLGDNSDDGSPMPTDAFARLAGSPFGLLEMARRELAVLLSGPTIQARCLECVGFAPQPKVTREARSGWLAKLAAFATQ